jgi:ring-1,2-phenylacetyl-CoA epoxidase subunit PaaC
MNAAAELAPLHITPPVQYVLRLADTCLIHAQRLAEWCGHGPVLEEDIALTNMALDLVGQSRSLLTLAGQMAGQTAAQTAAQTAGQSAAQTCGPAAPAWDEDQLAFLRSEFQYFNLTLVEQPLRRSSAHAPGGDFADTVLRNFLVSSWLKQFWQALAASSTSVLADLAAKAVKEARYQQQHNADWVVRLGDGNAESARRMAAALQRAWPFVAEMFAHDSVDDAAVAQGLGPARQSLRADFMAEVGPVLAAAGLQPPADTPFVSSGTRGRHSEHMGFILAEMQSLQRQFPGGRW